MSSILDTILDTTLQQTIKNNKNSFKLKIAIDTVCFQLETVSNTNNSDICYIWEHFLSTLPSNKDNFNYEILLLQRTQPNGSSYQFKKELHLDTKFKMKTIPYFNYMCMNQDVDILNNICNVNKIDVFISSSFTYCTIIPNIVVVYDMKPEIIKKMSLQPPTNQLIQKNKALLNASGFITFSKKTYTDLLEFYPHISKNEFPINIIKHNLNNTLSQKTLEQEDYKLHTLDTYFTTLETPILKPQSFINIIVQSYPESNPDRVKELNYCMKKNLENPYVKMVYDFGSGIELFDSGSGSDSGNSCSDASLKNKYKQITHTKWLTFEMAINFANTKHEFNTSNKREYWCILNLDIFLDVKSNWNTIRGQLNNGFIYAQSRHEFNILGTGSDSKIVAAMDSNFAQLFHANTQDAWLFKTPLNTSNIDFDFELGFLGCDNAIADRFVRAGYKVINQPMTYKIFHYDSAKGKTSTNYLEKHSKETKEKTENMSKPKNKYPERSGCYLVPNYDQMLNMNNRNEVDLIQLINNLGGCSNFERYEFISKLFSDRILITNP
jgi:hypothetical protein